MRVALAISVLAVAAAWWASRRADVIYDTANPSVDDVYGGATLDPLQLPAPAGEVWRAPMQAMTQAFTQLGGKVRKLFQIPPAGQQYAETIRAAEQHHGIPETLLARVLWQESKFAPDVIDGRRASPAGALGIAQFMPATARQLGIDPLNPREAIPASAKYLRARYDQFGTWGAALAAYNWGQGNLAKRGIAKAPPETKAYVSEILADVTV